mmetsp:Transcript_34751/g.66353  ORF Transcript_34751/g.66353 Transcript_34751/m.66353 type:complete len:221 (+) Transcript_34751:3506-4168(+)
MEPLGLVLACVRGAGGGVPAAQDQCQERAGGLPAARGAQSLGRLPLGVPPARCGGGVPLHDRTQQPPVCGGRAQRNAHPLRQRGHQRPRQQRIPHPGGVSLQKPVPDAARDASQQQLRSALEAHLPGRLPDPHLHGPPPQPAVEPCICAPLRARPHRRVDAAAASAFTAASGLEAHSAATAIGDAWPRPNACPVGDVRGEAQLEPKRRDGHHDQPQQHLE